MLPRPSYQPGSLTLFCFLCRRVKDSFGVTPRNEAEFSITPEQWKQAIDNRQPPKLVMPDSATRGQCVLRAVATRNLKTCSHSVKQQHQYLQPRKSLKVYLLKNWPNNYTQQLLSQSINFLAYNLLFKKSVVLILKTTLRKTIKILPPWKLTQQFES